MEKGILSIRLLMLCAMLSFTAVSFAQDFEFEDERELAKEVLKSLQEGNVELFSSYCIDDERMAKMLDEMGDKTEMEKEIKRELSEMPSEDLRNEAIRGFDDALGLAKVDTFNLEDAVYPELAFYKKRFEVTNLKCSKVKVDISTNKKYMMILDMFSTQDDIFIYDFRMIEGVGY